MLEFSQFRDMVRDKEKLPVSVYRALNQIRKTGVQYEAIFQETADITGIRKYNVDGYIGNFSSNKGSRNVAAAVYYWFHVKCADKGYAALIDEALFEHSLASYFSEFVDDSQSEPASPGPLPVASFSVPGTSETLTRYDHCRPLRDMARHITGLSLEEPKAGAAEGFFEKYETPPSWFGAINMPRQDRAVCLWTAVNTLCHAASHKKALTPREVDRLVLFMMDHTGDIPDTKAPLISAVLREIRQDLIPERDISEYSDFRFWRTYKENPHVRRLRMLHGAPVASRYRPFVDSLYFQHQTALESLLLAESHIGEYNADFAVELAMGLASVVHALAIDPHNEAGTGHPYIRGWMSQLDDIAQDQPRALIHLIFAKLQIAALSGKRLEIVETLHDLTERLQRLNLTNIPLFEALEMNLACVDEGDHHTQQLKNFLNSPTEEQVHFMIRCNIGILPQLRDRFVEHHIQTKSSLAPIVRARFGSALR